MSQDKITKIIFAGLAIGLLVLALFTKSYLSLIYFALGVAIGLVIAKPRPGGL